MQASTWNFLVWSEALATGPMYFGDGTPTWESLTWFLGNTLLLAVWWIISGVLGGLFIGVAGGAMGLSSMERPDMQRQMTRMIGSIGGGIVGLSGGAIIGRIPNFSGILGMLYLWSFVAMMFGVFISEPRRHRRHQRRYWNEFPDYVDYSVTEQISNLFSELHFSGRVFQGIMGGAVIGFLFGAFSGIFVPLSEEGTRLDRHFHVVLAAALFWAVAGGAAGAIGTMRSGLRHGIAGLVLGLAIGFCVGGVLLLVRDVFGDGICGAVNGAIGGMLAGAIFANEYANRHML